jgi:hypothetical protein
LFGLPQFTGGGRRGPVSHERGQQVGVGTPAPIGADPIDERP